MAKVQGPLFSIEARGSVAKSLCYFPWKGRNVIRKWLVPSNPQTGAQGDRRIMLGGLGKATAVISTLSQYATFARAAAAAGQTWISHYVKYIMDNHFQSVVAFDAKYDEYLAHGQIADFVSEATALGMTTFNLDYKSMDHGMVLGFQLYIVGTYGTDQYTLNNAEFNAAPYTKVLANWVLADIQLMVADFAAL